MIHTYLCRAPRTTTTGTTTDGASTVLPTNPLFLSLSLSLSHTHTHLLVRTLSLSLRSASFSLSLFFASVSHSTRATTPYAGVAIRRTRQESRKAASQPASQPATRHSQGAIGLRSVWVANQDAKVRIPSTRRFHVAVENHHEDAT